MISIRSILLTFGLLTTLTVFSDDEDREDLFLSSPDQIASLTCESSDLIGGLISPLSGQVVLRRTDLVAKGAQNVVLSRTYVPPYMPFSFEKHKHHQEQHDRKALFNHLKRNYKGWQFWPHTRLEYTPHSWKVRLADPNGMTLDFRLSPPNYFTTALACPACAITNAAGDLPSGKYDPRNTRISQEGNTIIVHAPDGTMRFYLNRNQKITKISYLYLLDKEILPNGKVQKYHYNQEGCLDYIESLDPKERYSYAFIRVAGTPFEGHCHFTSSSGETADYTYHRRWIKWKIKERKGKSYEKFNLPAPPILTAVSSPFYRHESLDYCEMFLLGPYFGKDHVFSLFNTGFGGRVRNRHYRVHKLLLPVGQNDASVPAYELDYQPPVIGQSEGATTVKNSDGTSTVYHFSKDLLPISIQYFGQDGNLKKEKIFFWDKEQWLESVEMRDGQKNLFYKKTYEYDRFGNPRLEVLIGDLTGEGRQETYTTQRIFSEDGRHLLLREETEDGKAVCFSYLPNTNLITSRLTKDVDKIILREFWIYDDCNNLIQTISDDGASEDKDNLSDVNQRTLTTYTLRQSAPFLHMPEWIEEAYWENGVVKPLKKTHLRYDDHGNIAQEEIYDAEGQYAYTICKTHNERGDLLTETNRLGQEAIYTYKPRGHLETSTNFSHRLHTIFHHDTKGRLREQIEKGDDGIVHTTSSEYDFHDRLIRKQDPFQNTTSYTCDPLVNKVEKTDYPPIASIDGQIVDVSTLSSHDSFGRELTRRNANGHLTTWRYNIYGSPIEIIHPDGGRETFRYTKNGQLASHTDPDGLTVQYKRDVLGRVLFKTYISEGQTLAEEMFTYNSFNLLTETDKEGNLKEYFHDGAGRKIRESFCGRVTDFSYDPLGWLAVVCRYNDDNTLWTHYKRDLEGQILEEYQTDTSGNTLYKISYSYDGDSNRKTITHYIQGNEAVGSFEYDSLCRLIKEKDAEGYITTKIYDEHGINPLGQKVLQTTTIDPRGITTVETSDALDRTVKQEVFSPEIATISCQEMTNDPQGNILYRRDHVYEGDHFRNTQTVKYTYTSKDQIESLTRAFGTADARTTTYTYFLSGKPKTKTLPDGVTLAYSYHPLGFMSHLDSSDGKIHHIFEYDRMGYLRYARDENLDIAIERKVDPFGNVLQETFPNGLAVNKGYDHFNRLISLKMDSFGEVLYTYDPLHLRTVTRISGSREALYTHAYGEYDLDGHLLAEDLIGGLGQIAHTTDLRGQKASISSSWFSQECKFDPAGNLINSVTDGTEHRYSYDGLSQLYSENSSIQSMAYAYDSVYNRTQKNGKRDEVNDLNEMLISQSGQSSCDLNGNQYLRQTLDETFRFIHDPLNRLIEVTSERKKVQFINDPMGRRLSKIVYMPTGQGWNETMREHYLYHGQNEIGAFESYDEAKNLRVFGLAKYKDNPATVGVEIDGQVFAPILDVQGNIRRLIDPKTRTIADSYDFTAFGEELPTSSYTPIFNPWRFASKRFDPELGLIYFGKRYYDPLFGRWLTTDPACFVDSCNLYQYVFNNPFRYVDPDGTIAFMIPLVIWGLEVAFPTLASVAMPLVYTAGSAVIAYAGYTAIEALNKNHHTSTVWDSPARSHYAMKSSTVENDKNTKKKKPPYSGDKLSDDPTQCPGEGFEWKGKGPPGSGQGSWVKGDGKEKEVLYPDLDHPPPKKPHWDYTGPDWEKGARLNIDGTWEPK